MYAVKKITKHCASRSAYPVVKGEGASTQKKVIGEVTTSRQNNTIGQGESNNNYEQQTLVFLSHSG